MKHLYKLNKHRLRIALLPASLATVLVAALLAVRPGAAAALLDGAGYTLDWWTADGGGATSVQAGGYTLGSTAGQPDAGRLEGSGYTLNGGFWAGTAVVTPTYPVYLPLGLRDHIPYFPGPCEREDNDSPSQANGPLRPDTPYCGYPDDARDYFSIYVPAGGAITVELTEHVGQGVQLQLFYQSSRVAYVWQEPYRIEHTGPPGWYYIFIYTASGYSTTEPYTLYVTHP